MLDIDLCCSWWLRVRFQSASRTVIFPVLFLFGVTSVSRDDRPLCVSRRPSALPPEAPPTGRAASRGPALRRGPRPPERCGAPRTAELVAVLSLPRRTQLPTFRSAWATRPEPQPVSRPRPSQTDAGSCGRPSARELSSKEGLRAQPAPESRRLLHRPVILSQPTFRVPFLSFNCPEE